MLPQCVVNAPGVLTDPATSIQGLFLPKKELAPMQARSDIADLSEKFLSCSICAEGFSDGPLTPRLLPCQHSFCSRCVDNIGSSGTFSCPLCCKAIPCNADSTPSEQFPKNRTLSSLLDWVQSTRGSKERSQPGEGLRVCELHEDERRKFFCRTCGVTVCPCCALDSHRQGHDLDSVQSVLQQARQNVTELAASMRALQVGVQGKAEQTRARLQQLEDSKVKVRSLLEDVMEGLTQLEERVETATQRGEASLQTSLDSLASLQSWIHETSERAEKASDLDLPEDLLPRVEEMSKTREIMSAWSEDPVQGCPALETHQKASAALKKLLGLLDNWDGDWCCLSLLRSSEPNTGEESGGGSQDTQEVTTESGHRGVSVSISDDVTVVCPYLTWTRHPQNSKAAEAGTPDATPPSGGPQPVCHFRGIVGTAPLPRDAVTFWQVIVTIPLGIQAGKESPLCEAGLANKAAIRACGEADSLGLMDAGSSGVLGCEARTLEVKMFPDENTVSVVPVSHYDSKWFDVTSVRTGNLTRCTLGFLLNGPMETLRVLDVAGVERLWDSPVDLKEALWPVAQLRGAAGTDDGVTVELQSGEEVMRHALCDLLRKLM